MQDFRRFLLNWHVTHGRHELPWRQTEDPYKILVSELMLQQTQVERVIPKYLAFIERFPTVESLAAAPLSEVLTLWQGLGYNRRARFLQQAAQAVVKDFAGIFPRERDALLELPGIGPYTASAVTAFAYDGDVDLIETNVRTVCIHHFFPERTDVSDAELLPLVVAARGGTSSRVFYAAVMDYGSYLKKVLPNPSRRSKHHTTQSRFAGSLRQMRGAIIRQLTKSDALSETELQKLTTTEADSQHFDAALAQLLVENMIEKNGTSYTLAT